MIDVEFSEREAMPVIAIGAGSSVPAHQPGSGFGDPLIGGGLLVRAGSRPRWRESSTYRGRPL
jgi:hypothetical protein